MATIPYPVTLTKISTTQWGIPVTDQINANTNLLGSHTTQINANTTTLANLPKGLIARVTGTANVNAISGGVITDMSITVNLVAGRAYRISLLMGTTTITGPSAGSDRWTIVVNRAGVAVGRVFDSQNPLSTYITAVNASIVDLPPASGSIQYTFLTTQSAGSNTWTLNATTSVPRIATIEDLGVFP
jgi:hypothetical protein